MYVTTLQVKPYCETLYTHIKNLAGFKGWLLNLPEDGIVV